MEFWLLMNALLKANSAKLAGPLSPDSNFSGKEAISCSSYEVTMSYQPYDKLPGGFSTTDGTIDFYLRIKSILTSSDILLDMGAGRAGWYEDDECEIRKNIRFMKGNAFRVIAADIDEVVLENKASDEQIVMKDGRLDLPEGSVDLVVADYVLEHIENPRDFVGQISLVLKKGGWFCARTPHKYSYVALIASLLENSKHPKWLRKVQPGRKEIDVFPTSYKLNTMSDLTSHFGSWTNHSFLFQSDPSYFFGNRLLFKVQLFLHKILYREFSANIFVFFQKN